MYKYFAFAILILPNILYCQIPVFKYLTNQIDFPRNNFTKGSHHLICYGKNFADDFGVAEIDSNGNIVNNNIYGTALGWEELLLANRQANNEIMMMGLSFWDGVANVGNYKGYVMIIDTNGNYKKSFFIKNNATFLNRINNGIFLDGYYYFAGMDADTSGQPRPFICKTDTTGNILWYQIFTQQTFYVPLKMGLEFDYSRSHLLVGISYIDSVVNNNYYHSYNLIRLDTSGNFINRIPLPEFASNIHYTGSNSINQISRIFNDKYIVCGNREQYLLDSQFNIIDSINLAIIIHPAIFGHKNLYDNSYIIGGDLGFSKIYQGAIVFTKNFTDEPKIISLKDVIPTIDGGYLATILKDNGTEIIKMDCDGNYVNPISCWATSTNELAKINLQMNYFNNHYTFNNKSEHKLEAKLFDLQGRALQQFAIEKGISNMEIGNYARGIYVIAIAHEGRVVKTEKILLE